MAKSRKVLTFHEYMQNMAKSASPKKRSRIKKQENPPITPTPTLTPYAQATRTLGRNAGTGPMTAAQIGATSTPVTGARIWRPTITAEPEYTATPSPEPTFDVTNTPSPTITPTPVSTDYPDEYTDLRNVLVGTPMPQFGEQQPPFRTVISDYFTNPIRQTAVRGVTNQELTSLQPTPRKLSPTEQVFIPKSVQGITNPDTPSLTVEQSEDLAKKVINAANDARLMFGQNAKVGNLILDPEDFDLAANDYGGNFTLDRNLKPVFPPTLSDLLQMPLNEQNRQMFRERFGRDTFNADDLKVIEEYLTGLDRASKVGATTASTTGTNAQNALARVGNTVASDPKAQNDFWSKFFGATDERQKSRETSQSDLNDYIQPMISGYYDFQRFNRMNIGANNLLDTVRGYIDEKTPAGGRLPYDSNIDRKVIEQEYPVVSTEVARVLGTAQAKKPPQPAYLDPTQVGVLYGANEYGIGDKRETGYDEERDRDWIDVTAPDYVKYRVFTGDPNQPSVAISHPGLTATARKLTGTPTTTPTATPKGNGAVTGARQTATAQAEKDFVTEARNTLTSFANDGKGADNAFDAISVLRQYRPNSVTIDKYGNASYTDPVTKQVIIVDSDGLVTRNTIPQATGTAQALNSMYATPTATSEPTATTTPTATQSPEEDMAAYDAEKQKLIEDIDTYVKQEKTNTKGFFQRLNALAQMGALKDDAQYGKYLESPSGRVYFGADVNEYLNNNYVLDQSTRPFAVTNPTLTALAGQPPDTASSDSFLPAIGSPLDVAEDEKPLYTPPQALGYVPANWRTDAEIANTYNEPAYVTQRPSYNPTPTPGTGTNTQQGGGNWFQNAWNWVTGNDEQGMIAPKKVYAADRNTATPSVGTATTTRTPTFTATPTTTPTQTATASPTQSQRAPQSTPTATQTGAQLQDMQRQRAQQQAQAVLSQSQNKAVSRWSAPNGAMQAAQAQAQQPAPNGAMQAAQAQQQIQPKPAVPAVPPFDPSKMGYTAPTATVQYGTYKPASSATTGAAGTAGTPATSTTTQPAVTAPSVATQTVGTKGSAKLARDKKKHGKLKKDISVGTGLTAHATQPVKESPMPKIKTSYGRYKYPKSSPSSTKYGVTNDTFRKQMNVMYPRQEMANVMPMPPAREHNRVQQMPMSYESPQYVRKMAGSEGMNDMQFTAPSLPKLPEQKRDVQKYTSANSNKYEKRGK